MATVMLRGGLCEGLVRFCAAASLGCAGPCSDVPPDGAASSRGQCQATDSQRFPVSKAEGTLSATATGRSPKHKEPVLLFLALQLLNAAAPAEGDANAQPATPVPVPDASRTAPADATQRPDVLGAGQDLRPLTSASDPSDADLRDANTGATAAENPPKRVEGAAKATRLMAGAGLSLGSAGFSPEAPGVSLGVVGLEVRGGALGQHFGLEIEASADTSFTDSGLRAALLLEAMPVDWLSVGIGPAFGWRYLPGSPPQCPGPWAGLADDSGQLPPPSCTPGTPSNSSRYAAGAVRVDYLLAVTRSRSDEWGALDLGLECQWGRTLGASGGTPGAAVYVTLGGALFH
jgi:hypothetical protein